MNTPLKRLVTKPKPDTQELEDRLKKSQDWAQRAESPLLSADRPWLTAHPRVKVGYALRMSEPLHAKLKWLIEHEPNASMHKFIIEAIEDKVKRHLEKHLGTDEAV